jgi:hypothetical protein
MALPVLWKSLVVVATVVQNTSLPSKLGDGRIDPMKFL